MQGSIGWEVGRETRGSGKEAGVSGKCRMLAALTATWMAVQAEVAKYKVVIFSQICTR